MHWIKGLLYLGENTRVELRMRRLRESIGRRRGCACARLGVIECRKSWHELISCKTRTMRTKAQPGSAV